MEGLRAFKDANITRHDSLMPGFAKTNMSTRPVSRIEVSFQDISCYFMKGIEQHDAARRK